MLIVNTIIDIVTITLFGVIIIAPFILPNTLSPISNALGWGLVTVYYINKHIINGE